MTTLGRVNRFGIVSTGRQVVSALRREQDVGNADTLSYVVMPDHVHWLMQLTGRKNLSITVGNVKAISAKKTNILLGRTGPIWQTGFHDRAIRKEEDLPAVARYIVANPIRAGLVKRAGDYAL